jgi:hypothetical protein
MQGAGWCSKPCSEPASKGVCVIVPTLIREIATILWAMQIEDERGRDVLYLGQERNTIEVLYGNRPSLQDDVDEKNAKFVSG